MEIATFAVAKPSRATAHRPLVGKARNPLSGNVFCILYQTIKA